MEGKERGWEIGIWSHAGSLSFLRGMAGEFSVARENLKGFQNSAIPNMCPAMCYNYHSTLPQYPSNCLDKSIIHSNIVLGVS